MSENKNRVGNDYLWIGSYTTDVINENIQKLGYKNSAQHIAQKNILEGIESVLNKKFDTLGAINLPDGAKNIWIFKEIEFSHGEGSNDRLVKYVNIKYLNRLFMIINMRKQVRKWINNNNVKKNDIINVYMYEMRSVCLVAARTLKRYCNAHVNLIVPDLPMYMNGEYTGLKKLLKKIDYASIKRKLKYIDTYILFTRPMAKYLGIEKKKWMVMEGTINIKDIKNKKEIIAQKKDKCIVMYSGIIDESYGILLLIEAVEKLGSEYELWITGSGSSENKIKEYVKGKLQIKYFGYLSSREEVLRLHREATVLINIRNPYLDASKYCFPSKLFEYMQSGTTVVSSKIEGIPDEYYNYIIPINEFSVDGIAQAIKYANQLGEEARKKMGERAKEFIENNKNNLIQSRRIISFINGEENEKNSNC